MLARQPTTRSLGNVKVIMGRPLRAVEGWRIRLVSTGRIGKSEIEIPTLPVVPVGAVLAAIPVVTVALVLDIALPLTGTTC